MGFSLKKLSLKKLAKFAGKVAQGAAAVSNPAGFLLSKLKTSGQTPAQIAKPIQSKAEIALQAKLAPSAKKHLGISDAAREQLGLGSNAATLRYGTSTANAQAKKSATLKKATAKVTGPSTKQKALYSQWLALGKPGTWVEFANEYGEG